MEYRVVNRSSERITQKYKPLQHRGVDIGFSKDEENNKVHANSIGVVYEVKDGYDNNTRSTGAETWGNYVLVKHPNGMFTRYAHLKEGLLVKEGEQVNEDTVIGIIGNTGRSYGRHLHFEVATGYSSSKRINPTEYLNKPVYVAGIKKHYSGIYPKLRLGIYGWKRGDKNANVGLIQAFLNWCLDLNLAVDNSFGPATEKAVLDYQKRYGLKQDKKFGPACIKMAKEILK